MYGMLVPVGGGDPIPLRKTDIIVGRRNGCDIVLGFSNVSGKHCQLVLSNGYWYVLDLKSTNGVKVNGAKVSDHRMDPGATLAISKHIFTLQYDPVANGATGPPPAALYREDDILSQSLMEKAGLQRPSLKQAEDPGSTIPDMPIVISPAIPSADSERNKIDFFSQLKFD